jgi:iron complex transport system substrate-binding protein
MSAGAALLAACGTRPGTVAEDGSITVRHAFGETKVPGPPKRVVSAGFTEHDDLLAVGVVPIAVTNWFGDQPFATWPWAKSRLGAAEPVVLNLDNGIQVDQIADLKPDLIVATNAGVDAETFKKLSATAPTIPQPGQDAFFGPWKDQAILIGQAVFQADQMRSLIAAIDDKFATGAKNNPQFNGKKALFLQGGFGGDNLTATLPGRQTEFLTQLGFAIPDSITAFKVGDRAVIPRDKAMEVLNSADVLVWATENDHDESALVVDPTFKQLAATKREANIFLGKDFSAALAFASPLSYGMIADLLPQQLARALA